MNESTERIRKLTKRRWLVLAASCLVNLCIGSLYAWSVFAPPMAAYLSSLTGITITAGNLAIAFAIANTVGPITMISGGYINDRFGPKWVIFLGGLMYGSGFLVCGLSKSIGMVVLGFGVLCGLAVGLVYGCTVSNSVKFFPDRRGLIGGLTTASYGISSVIVPPVAGALIMNSGVLTAFRLLGAAFIIIISVSSFFIIKSPQNFIPYHWLIPGKGLVSGKASANEDKTGKTLADTGKTEVNEKDWKGMLADPVFYVMILMLACGANFGMMIISQASSISQSMVNLSVASATLVVSLIALFNALGRVSAGFLSDRFGRINTLSAMLFLALIAMGLLYFSSEQRIAMFYIAISLTGMCFGAFMGVYPGFTADQFGSRNNSVNYGIMFIGFALAGLTGPNIVAGIYFSTNSYQPAFLVGAALAAAGLVLSVIFRYMIRYKKIKKINKIIL